MKKVSVKKQLVDFMLANGNDFRYVDVIKTILKINRGRNYKYTREDRGYFATNMCQTYNGYLVSGAGVCGLYKNSSGRWSAKYWSEKDKAQYKKVKEHNALGAYKWHYRGVTKNFIKFVPVN